MGDLRVYLTLLLCRDSRGGYTISSSPHPFLLFSGRGIREKGFFVTRIHLSKLFERGFVLAANEGTVIREVSKGEMPVPHSAPDTPNVNEF